MAVREPLYSLAAEEHVLGALLGIPGTWGAVEGLAAVDFYRPDHRHIFEAVASAASRGEPYDFGVIAEGLERAGKLEPAGGRPYIYRLAADTPGADNLRAYVQIVRERARARRLIEMGERTRSLLEGGAPSTDAAGAIAEMLEELQRAQEAAVALPGDVLTWAALVGQEPPARSWIVPHWIPAGHVTLLAGRGGIGKTLLAQHIATAVALGAEYLEALSTRRVLMWAGEDDYDELWRRQLPISSYLGAPLESLSGLTLRSCAGADITLAAPVMGTLRPTPLLKLLREEVRDLRAALVVLDNIARLYGGSENDRHQVTTFLAWLQNACAGAAILLVGHPAKAQGSEYSGSTAWEGAVRARLYFGDRPPDAEKDAKDETPIDPHVRYLARRKSNYSDLDMRQFGLHDGVLVPGAIAPRTRGPTGSACEDIVLRAMRRLAERDVYGTGSTASPAYLPKLARQYGLLEDATEHAFGAAMRALILRGRVCNQKVGTYPDRHARMGLVAVAQMDRGNDAES